MKAIDRVKVLARQIERKYNDHIIAKEATGKEKEIPLIEDWVKDPDGKGAHFALRIPEEFGIKDTIIIAAIKKGYMGAPYSFEVGRRIHVIKGRVYNPVKNEFADVNTLPIKVEAGEFMNTHGLEDSVIAIEILEDEND